MTPECRNDCLEPLRFPKRPNNRPGLSHIDYRIGTYSDFREALLRKLNQDPLLASWTHRGADDPGIALLEGASILGDILTFYQELYANEAYLRTAQWRESIADLVRLLGYRLAPGLGGRGTFAFEVKSDKPVVVPAGFAIKAQVQGLEQQADFETVEEFVAEPALSKFNLYRPSNFPSIATGTKEFSIASSVLNENGLKLNQGDKLMLVKNPNNAQTERQIVVIEEVRVRFDRTEITIKGDWRGGSAGSSIAAYKLGRSFKYFGHNAPATITVVQNGVPSQSSVSFHVQPGTSTNVNRSSFPLDSEVKDLSVGSTLLVSWQPGAGAGRFFERGITKAKLAPETRGALTGGTTVVELEATISLAGSTDIRNIEFHEVVGVKLQLKAVRAPISSADGSRLHYFGDLNSYQKLQDRELFFARDDQIESVQVSLTASGLGAGDSPALRQLILNPPLQVFTLDDFPLENPTVTVYGNLVAATQGKSEKEAVLGNGDNRQTFQTFKLPKSPLTYHHAVGETPPEAPELQIYVNDRLWQRVPSFFNHGPKEEIYLVREDNQGDSWVQFGDGKTGIRLPSGIANVRAKFRTGIGAYGALKPDTTVQPGGKLNKLDKIQLPGLVTGGVQPEDEKNAQEAAPGKVQSLDRLVSLQDFESETLALAGVSKVAARWGLVNNVTAVVITVLMETGRDDEIEAVRSILAQYNRCRGPQRFPIILHPGRRQYIYLDAVYGLDPTFRQERVEKAIKEALGVAGEEGSGSDGSNGLLGIRSRHFGEREYATRIAGAIQNVEGVTWARVTALGVLGEADDPATLALPAEPKPLNAVAPCDNAHVLALHSAHLQLSPAAMPAAEAC